jgi:hypothetical protein
MDPAEYLDARWYALVRAAVDLGAPEQDAPALVREVLADNARRIRRAEDPDPLVHEALREAVLGRPPTTRRRLRPVVLAVAALVAVGTLVALTRPDGPPADRLADDPVPSLFGYDAGSARTLLEERGLAVTLRPRRACEVLDRVLGSIPPAGAPYERGDEIVVYTSLPADVDCLSDYTDRETAWRQTDLMETLRRASAEVALVDERPVTYSLPAIRVTRAPDAFTLLIRAPGGAGPGVRLEVHRTDGVIDWLALYPASAPSS